MHKDFYERYGIEWHSNDRRHMEKMATLYKVSNLCLIMEGLKIGSILDFGCGLGDALDILATHFSVAEAIGIDVSSTMIEYAMKQYPKYKFVNGSIEELQKFRVDLITFIDVIEHIEDIPLTLKVAKKNARYIAIKVPLEKTLLINIMNRLGLRKKESRLYESEGHLYEFNKSDIEEIIKKTGIEIVRTRTDFVPKNVRFSTFKKNLKKTKSGGLAKIEYFTHLFLSKLPYPMTRMVFKLLNGVDLFILCKS